MENELYHHGIIGQKWGVRRYQYEDGSLTPAGRKRYNKEAKSEKKVNKQESVSKTETGHKVGEPYTKEELMGFRSASQVYAHMDEYTDQELRTVLGRIQLETQVRTMASAENQKKVSKGKQFIKDTLTESGKSLAKTVVTGTMKYESKKILSKYNPELAQSIFGGKKDSDKDSN